MVCMDHWMIIWFACIFETQPVLKLIQQQLISFCRCSSKTLYKYLYNNYISSRCFSNIYPTVFRVKRLNNGKPWC